MLFVHRGHDDTISVLGILDLYVSGIPNANFFEGLAVHINVTYVAVSISLNLLLTSLICGRVLYYAHTLQKQLGPGVAETYFGVAAIIIESALPYTLSGMAYVVSYGLNSEINILFLSLYVMFMACGDSLGRALTVFADDILSVYHHKCSFFGWRPEGHGMPPQLHMPVGY